MPQRCTVILLKTKVRPKSLRLIGSTRRSKAVKATRSFLSNRSKRANGPRDACNCGVKAASRKVVKRQKFTGYGNARAGPALCLDSILFMARMNTKQFGHSLVAAAIRCLDYDSRIAVFPSMQGHSTGFRKTAKISVRRSESQKSSIPRFQCSLPMKDRESKKDRERERERER